jgi:Uncharacterized conserved protein
MKNFIESGEVFYVALNEDIGPGEVVIAGELVGVVISGGKAGVELAVKRRGVVVLPKASGAIGQGDKVYWKADEGTVVKTATGNTLLGCAYSEAEAASGEIAVLLKG